MCQLVGVFAEQNLATAGLLLQALGDIDHISDNRVVHDFLRPNVSHHRVAGVQPDSQAKARQFIP